MQHKTSERMVNPALLLCCYVPLTFTLLSSASIYVVYYCLEVQ